MTVVTINFAKIALFQNTRVQFALNKISQNWKPTFKIFCEKENKRSESN